MERIKKIYDWVIHWSANPHAVVALFILAFCEASFFPVPPDVLLIAMCISRPKRSFYFALICALGSVIGGGFGYLIGLEFFEWVGRPILNFYHGMEPYERIRVLYQTYGVWAVLIAGFTPIPYKVFTIASGVFGMNFPLFMLASAISRSARFFIVSGLIYIFGDAIKNFIDRYFNLLSYAFMALLVLGFVLVKYLI